MSEIDSGRRWASTGLVASVVAFFVNGWALLFLFLPLIHIVGNLEGGPEQKATKMVRFVASYPYVPAVIALIITVLALLIGIRGIVRYKARPILWAILVVLDVLFVLSSLVMAVMSLMFGQMYHDLGVK